MQSASKVNDKVQHIKNLKIGFQDADFLFSWRLADNVNFVIYLDSRNFFKSLKLVKKITSKIDYFADK